MKRPYYILMMSVILLSNGCMFKYGPKSDSPKLKEYCLRMGTHQNDYEYLKIICLELPSKGKVKKIRTGDSKFMVEYRISYGDGSIVYVKNDIWSISQVNAKNMYAVGIAGYRRDNLIDPIDYSGQVLGQATFWKDVFSGEVIVGYSGVSENRKGLFDRALLSLIIYEKR